MPVCASCGSGKEPSEFYADRGNVKGLKKSCKDCVLSGQRARRAERRAEREARGEAQYRYRGRNPRKNKANRMAYVDNYLRTHPCVECGEADPVVLQFNHVRGRTATVRSVAVQGGFQRLIEEIAKCEVRCANCHIRRHAQDNGRAARFSA